MTTTDLRPRSASELVDAAFRLFRRHYGAFVTLSAAAAVPSLLFEIAQLGMAGHVNVAVSPAWLGVGVLLSIPYYGLTESCFVSLASDAYHGGPARLADAVRRGVPRAPSSALGFLLVVAVVMAGLLLFVVPGVILLSRLYSTTPAIVLDGTSAPAAIRRTWARTRGRATHVLGTVALTFLLYVVLLFGAGAIAGVVASFTSPFVASGISVLVTVLVYPVLSIVSTLLYYDLRIRSEGYDLEVMAERLGAAPAGVPAYPPPADARAAGAELPGR